MIHFTIPFCNWQVPFHTSLYLFEIVVSYSGTSNNLCEAECTLFRSFLWLISICISKKGNMISGRRTYIESTRKFVFLQFFLIRNNHVSTASLFSQRRKNRQKIYVLAVLKQRAEKLVIQLSTMSKKHHLLNNIWTPILKSDIIAKWS